MRTRRWLGNTLGLAMGGAVESGFASTIYGLESHASTTTQRTNKVAQLSELLSYLEKEVESLEYRYLEAYAILNFDIKPRVKHLLSTLEEDTTK